MCWRETSVPTIRERTLSTSLQRDVCHLSMSICEIRVSRGLIVPRAAFCTGKLHRPQIHNPRLIDLLRRGGEATRRGRRPIPSVSAERFEHIGMTTGVGTPHVCQMASRRRFLDGSKLSAPIARYLLKPEWKW